MKKLFGYIIVFLVIISCKLRGINPFKDYDYEDE